MEATMRHIRGFNFLIDENMRVYRKTGTDYGFELRKEFGLCKPGFFHFPTLEEIRNSLDWVEVIIFRALPNGDVDEDCLMLDNLSKENWRQQVYEPITPKWWCEAFMDRGWQEWELWKEEVSNKLNLEEVINPVNPLDIEDAPLRPTAEDLELLRIWAGTFIYATESIDLTLHKFLGTGLYNDIWVNFVLHYHKNHTKLRVLDMERFDDNHIWAMDYFALQMQAYLGSLCQGVQSWRYFHHDMYMPDDIKPRVYPFEAAAILWRRGL